MRRAVVRVMWGVLVRGWPAVAVVPGADEAATGRAAIARALLRGAVPRSRARREADAAARKVAELAARVDALAAAMETAYAYAAPPDRTRLRAVPGRRGERRQAGG